MTSPTGHSAVYDRRRDHYRQVFVQIAQISGEKIL